jgi:ribonuclease D
MKIRGASALDPRHLAVLRELTIWRDEVSRAADVPPRTYLRDEVLLALARSPVKDVERLSRVRGLPRPVEGSQGANIVAATQKAFALPENQLPQQPHAEPSPREKFQCDSLWASAQAICFARGIDPALVSSRQEIAELRRHLATGGNPIDLRLLTGWRHAALGEMILEMTRQTL